MLRNWGDERSECYKCLKCHSEAKEVKRLKPKNLRFGMGDSSLPMVAQSDIGTRGKPQKSAPFFNPLFFPQSAVISGQAPAPRSRPPHGLHNIRQQPPRPFSQICGGGAELLKIAPGSLGVIAGIGQPPGLF
jgi:hypothetical protein